MPTQCLINLRETSWASVDICVCVCVEKPIMIQARICHLAKISLFAPRTSCFCLLFRLKTRNEKKKKTRNSRISVYESMSLSLSHPMLFWLVLHIICFSFFIVSQCVILLSFFLFDVFACLLSGRIENE